MRREQPPLHLSPSPDCPGSPLSVGQRSRPTLCWENVSQACGFHVVRGAEDLSSPFSPSRSSLPSPPSGPLASWSLREACCSLLQSDLISQSGGLFRDPLSTAPSLLFHCLSAPARAPPSPTPFAAEPGASLGSRPNRLQNARALSRFLRSPPVARPAPAAQTPALRARLSRPFRCSSQDGGRASRRLPRPLSVHFPSGGPPQEARQQAARPRTELRARGGERPDPSGPQQPPAPPVTGVGVAEGAAGTPSRRSLVSL